MATYGSTKRARPPQPPRKVQIPSGPKVFRPAGKQARLIGGPGSPPPDFRGTLPEWYAYWACLTLLGPERPNVWRYQDPTISGPFLLARVDIVVYQGPRRLAIRVVTERFHIATSASKQAGDVRQRLILERQGFYVVDIYDEHFMGDPTGKAVILVMKDALRGVERLNPITSGTSIARTARVTP